MYLSQAKRIQINGMSFCDGELETALGKKHLFSQATSFCLELKAFPLSTENKCESKVVEFDVFICFLMLIGSISRSVSLQNLLRRKCEKERVLRQTPHTFVETILCPKAFKLKPFSPKSWRCNEQKVGCLRWSFWYVMLVRMQLRTRTWKARILLQC